jgi:alpha-L-fucosidase
MKRHGRSIYGCTQAPAEFQTPPDGRLTYNPQTNRLYVHLLSWPIVQLHLDGFGERVEYAQLLNDASEIKFQKRDAYQSSLDGVPADTLTLFLPVRKPNAAVPVVELFLK